ncbi:hypothetical protein RND81_11G202800 [Saponaria officinalis]|uniref:CCHC-type domain-containing protein n=1 Tax=Saponaria officinalis TaxID=3572 RepID=A0AAW1HQL9_SAPOF
MTSEDTPPVQSSTYECLDDPLYLSNSDQPVVLLVSHQFDGTNFVSWKRDVLHALIAKNKKVSLTELAKLRIRETLQYASSAKELWSEICDRYGQTNSIEIYELKKDLGALVQENSSLVDYYSILKRTWESVDALDPVPLCTCGALDTCTCQMLKRLVEREVNAKLIQFLMGLNGAYEGVKTHILSLEPLPPLNKAFALLQKIERQKHLYDSSDLAVDAAAYNSTRSHFAPSSGFKKPRLQTHSDAADVKECHYCHSLGHIKSECFKLRECSVCGKKGHAPENCFKLKYASHNNASNTRSFRGRGRGQSAGQGYRRGANNVDVLTDHTSAHYSTAHFSDEDLTDPLSDVLADIHTTSPANTDFNPQMINAVVEQVMKAISDKNTTEKKKESGLSAANFAGIAFVTTVNSVVTASKSDCLHHWIIDTGATDHMIPDAKLLHNVKTLTKPILVGLPDGSFQSVHQIGTYNLTDQISLHNVFVVPGFKHGLLSVGRLVAHSNIEITFSSGLCVFQDHSSKLSLTIPQQK